MNLSFNFYYLHSVTVQKGSCSRDEPPHPPIPSNPSYPTSKHNASHPRTKTTRSKYSTSHPLTTSQLTSSSPKQPSPSPSHAEPSPPSSPEPSPSATQRRRTSPPASPSDDDTRPPDGEQQMVKQLIRLALASEYQRKPIRRTDITEKVLGSGADRRAFKTVFNTAQNHLRAVFGMEMVELPGREKVTLAQKRAAAAQQKSQSQQGKAPTAWTLITVLPSRFRDPTEILSPPAAPTAAEEGKYTSIYTLLISLIQLSGGQLPDAKLERYLRRVGMEDSTPLVSGGFERTERLLKRLEKEGYILKIRESAGQGEEDVFWIVGPRGKVEVGEMGVRGLVKAVYGEMDEAGEEELEGRIKRSLGLGEGLLPVRGDGGTKNGEVGKKRGRRRRDAEEEEEDDEEEQEQGAEEDEEE